MIEADALEQAIRQTVCLIPVALYFGIAVAIASTVSSTKEWFLCLVPDGLETVGDALLWLLLALFHLCFTPAAIIYFLVRGILRINISHIRKDEEE